MGNACKKPEDQVQPNKPKEVPKPPAAPDELDALNKRNEELRRRKAELEAELARWREEKEKRLQMIKQELLNIQQQGGVSVADPTDPGSVSGYTPKYGDGVSPEAQAELQKLRGRQELLETELKKLQTERLRMNALQLSTEAELEKMESILKTLGEGEQSQSMGTGSEETFESEAVEKEKQMQRIAAFYRPFKRPGNFQDALDESRVDAAECSTQFVRNMKAMFHDLRTGDSSWYVQKPLRGVLCDIFQCGDIPHDRWNCDLCDILDTNDCAVFL